MIKRRIGYILSISLFTLLSSGLPGFFYSYANATSAYDGKINSTSELKWTTSSGTIDITDGSQNNGKSWAWYFKTYLQRMCNNGANQTYCDAIERFENNLASGSGWLVQQIYIPYNGTYGFKVVLFEPGATITFDNAHQEGNSNWNNFKVSYGTIDAIEVGGFNFLNDSNFHMYSSGAFNIPYNSTGWELPYFTNYWYNTNNGVFYNFLFLTAENISYPDGFQGDQIPDGSEDIDGDGLSFAQESTQSTSDSDIDTDNDGISDYKESKWFSERDDVFCDNSTPKICAYPDPAKKDIYVEVDWMNNGTRDFKPTTTEIIRVVDAYGAKGINAHFDIGQYGGGEQLSAPSGNLYFAPTEDEVDFYDIKNGTSTTDPKFSPSRKGIWHYMITSMNYMNSFNESTNLPVAGTSGSSFPGDDDSIISIEKVEELVPYSSSNPEKQSIGISGTIIHELGHNLCLTDEASTFYTHQPTECIFQGIDNNSGNPPVNNPDSYFNLENYQSSMNYRYQLDTVDYSNGTHSTSEDHNDWAGIMLGIDDFVDSDFEWQNTDLRSRGSNNQINKLSPQEMIGAIQS